MQAYADRYRADREVGKQLQAISKQVLSGQVPWSEAFKKSFKVLQRSNKICNLFSTHPTSPSMVQRAEERIEKLKKKITHCTA